MFFLGFLPWSDRQDNGPATRSPLSCDHTVDAGPDATVCGPIGVHTLAGSTSGDIIFTEWSPATGLSDPYALSPTATISATTAYTLTAWAIDPTNPSIIVNGDFEMGNTGFSSAYIYIPDDPNSQSEMNWEGTYTTIHDPDLVHSNWSSCNDHTPSGSQMLVVNGAASLQDVWCQTVNVSQNSWYNVSAWVASVHWSSPASLQFSINDTPIGNIVNASNNTCNWAPFNASWNSGSNTTATICILNLNTSTGGNDFAIDDIAMFPLCSVEDAMTITVLDEPAPEISITGLQTLCLGNVAAYSASLTPNTTPIATYSWDVPWGASLLSGQGTPEATFHFWDKQSTSICLTVHTNCDQKTTCYPVQVNGPPDPPSIVAPATLCKGHTTTIYTNEIDPEDQYSWTIPPQAAIISGAGTNQIQIAYVSPGDIEICLDVTNECGTTTNCTNMSLLPQIYATFDTIICTGTTILINGNTYGNGVWTGIETFTSSLGCDSIVAVDISESQSLQFSFNETICHGDSIFLGGAFQKTPGVYTDAFFTIHGCDSIVYTTLKVNPVSQTDFVLYSCSPADVGQTFQVLSNQFGCDSMIVTTTYLLESDSVFFYSTTCDAAQTGTFVQNLTNSDGCDSVVVSTISFAPSDTTHLSTNVCAIADTGTVITHLINNLGCDSIVINNFVLATSPNTLLYEYTCSPLDSGVFITSLVNQFGCDSLIYNHKVYRAPDSTYVTKLSCNPQDTGVVIDHYTNVYGCDSLLFTVTTMESIHVCSVDAVYTVLPPLCFGEAGSIEIDITVGTGPFELTWSNAETNGTATFPSLGKYTIPYTYPGVTEMKLTSSNGLEAIENIQLITPQPLTISATLTTDYAGYGVACHGDSTAEAEALILSGGSGSLVYQWSNGSTSQTASQLHAGTYTLTVTDKNGCIVTDEIVITEPEPLQYQLEVQDIPCYGEDNGIITIIPSDSQNAEWKTSLNGSSPVEKWIYTDLVPGMHELVIHDITGCATEETVFISEPESWKIDLGPDTSINYSTPYQVSANITGNPIGNVQLQWSDNKCDNCPTREIDGIETTYLSVTATDEMGCTSEDRVSIVVVVDTDIYLPNIFSPDGDGINDIFYVSVGSLLEEIEELVVYDRWGNQVFQKTNFQADDPQYGWDGNSQGKPAEAGVYTYRVTARFIEGSRVVKYGDVTIVR